MAIDLIEKNLPASFCQPTLVQVKKLIELSTTFSIVGIPGMGISTFLRYLVTQNFAHCGARGSLETHLVHVDVNRLSKFCSTEFFELLLEELGGKKLTDKNTLELCCHRLEDLTSKYERVVIVFNRFDQLKKSFSYDFFSNLRYLRDVDKGKVVMIFAANRPLFTQAPQAVHKSNINMFSQSLYLPLYSPAGLLMLLNLYSQLLLSHPNLEYAVKLCGGHYQLLQLLLRSKHLIDNPLKDPVVRIQIREFYDYLTYSERQILKKLILQKKVDVNQDYLKECGWVKNEIDGYKVFTPLLSEYIKSVLRVELPLKEAKLFYLLRKNLEKVVSKEEIFSVVWGEGLEEASDWALDALIYRLRKNPVFATKYVLENRKKVGYILQKN